MENANKVNNSRLRQLTRRDYAAKQVFEKVKVYKRDCIHQVLQELDLESLNTSTVRQLLVKKNLMSESESVGKEVNQQIKKRVYKEKQKRQRLIQKTSQKNNAQMHTGKND